MADNRVQIIIDAKGGSQAAQEFQKAMKGMETLESKAATTSSSISGLASTFGKVSGAVSLAASAIAAAAIKLGSDYQKAVFSMSETFKARTDEMVKTAQGMSEKMKHYYDFTEIAYAFQKTSDSMQRYGITGDKYLKLVERAADVGAAKNLDLKESIDRIESAMRGEAEASEYLGVTLNDTYMKNMAFNGSLRDQWEKLSDNEKAYYRWIELMNQTEKYQGATGRATDTLSGALAALGNSIKDDFAPALQGYADELTTIVNKMREWYDINAKVKAQGRVAPDPLGLTAMYEPGPERSTLTWGGLKAFEAQQKANTAKEHGNKLAEEGIRLAEAEKNQLALRNKYLKEAETAQDAYVRKYKELITAWPKGGDEFEKAHAKIWGDLLKATQEKTTKSVSSKIDSNLVKLAEWVARYHGISEELFKALIKQESGWDIAAKSPKGAAGLAQIMPGTWSTDIKKMFPWLSNIWDPFQNMFGGAGYLRKILDMVGGNVPLALAGYNAGPYNKYVQAGQIPPYPETQNYVKSIMSSQGVGDELTWMREDQQRQLDEYWESWHKGAQEALDTEVSTMREILQSDTLTQSERVVLQEQYLAKRKEQIQAEAAEIERVTGNKVLAEKWAAEQIKQEQNQLVEHNIQQLQRMLEEENLTLQRREEIWRQIREKIQAGEVSLMDALRLGWREAVNQMNSATQSMNDLGKQAATGLRNALKDSFVALAKGDMKGLADAWERFADLMLNKWAEMLADAIMKWLDFSGSIKGGGGGLGDLFGGLFGWLGKLFGGGGTCPIAHGGVFSGAGIGAYASSVVMRPTLFPFAHGVGLMGEAGPEAILPLKRTAGGNLGVTADGMGLTVNVYEAPGTKARVEREQDGSLNVIIEQVEQALVSRMHRGSGMSGYLNQVYRRRM